MDISKFHGVGKDGGTTSSNGYFTGADLIDVPEVTLIDRFGRLGYDLYRKARGIHNSQSNPIVSVNPIGKEKTYGKILRAEGETSKRADSPIRKSRSQSQSTRKSWKIVI